MALDKNDKKWLKDNFITKSDAKSFVTKNDVKNFATKGDITRLDRKLEQIDGKLDDHFNYLDKDISHFKRKVASHLNIPVSELSVASD